MRVAAAGVVVARVLVVAGLHTHGLGRVGAGFALERLAHVLVALHCATFYVQTARWGTILHDVGQYAPIATICICIVLNLLVVSCILCWIVFTLIVQ